MKRSRPMLLAVAASALAACVGDPSTEVPAGAQPVTIQPVPGAADVRFYSGFTTRERLVIRDEATWTSTWEQLMGSQQPVPAVPKIDFKTSVVIVAAMGQRNSGGFV